MTTSSAYNRPELLAETEWLAEHLNDENVVVVDCEGWAAFQRAHIPGAVCSPNYNNLLKDPDAPAFVLNAERFAALMQEMGVGDDDLVVAYDSNRSLYATRLWWVLHYYGHQRVKVLNGGWRKWALEGRPISVTPTQLQKATFTPRVEPQWGVSSDEILASLENPGFVALDARSRGEHTGESPRRNRFGGHIPGAVHIEWLDNLVSDDTHVFRPAEELRSMYLDAGVTEDRSLIAPYCQGAVRAANSMFTLMLLGYDNVRNYDGSWAEWGNDERFPIANKTERQS